ncbi:hypothetical protein H6G97_02225 [Nostoc flagelliforme FACHB-838]|uniref:Uncharacterized protein n=1 Tax=Nostoc flagelliforme FACHB-838 TaxID=2692904 RepID=A0ABR8DJX1_9NOSO|nr:hypothetical protein [Nostoc flagelliforme]MBD2528435.1 hypothetical protein [Nostoc flagelliforme FACHB-838]
MKLSTIIKSSVCLLGLVGVSNFFAAPAKADQAAARGAVTVVRPSGSSVSVSGELVAPSGTQFAGPLTITPTSSGVAGGNDEGVATLVVDAGALEASTSTSAGTIEAAIALTITEGTFAEVQDVAALVRAASSGGME